MADAAAAARQAGVYSDEDALVELEAYLSLSIDSALTSASPLQQALAVLDERVRKRRLRMLLADPPKHPLVATLLALRCEVEGVRLHQSSS